MGIFRNSKISQERKPRNQSRYIMQDSGEKNIVEIYLPRKYYKIYERKSILQNIMLLE